MTSTLAQAPTFPPPATPSRSRPCITYIHGNRWDGVPARQRYLMEQMSVHADIFFLEESEDKKYKVSFHPASASITIIRGLMPMWIRFGRRNLPLAQRLWARRHLGHLRKKYANMILWDAQSWLDSYRFVPHTLAIFDCIDPVFTTDPAEVAAFHKREARMVRNADLVFASADSLKESCLLHAARDVLLLNNACAPEEYAPDLVAAAPRPDWWPASPNPIACYLGTLDARFDFDTVMHACRSLPTISFVLAGTALAEFRHRIHELMALPNVICPGRISVEHGRYALANCTIGLIPFTPGPMNDAINPVKMYAYALLGKPIVSTNVRELASRPDIATATANAADFAAAITANVHAANNAALIRRLKAFALQNTWRQRAQLAWQAIQPRLENARLR